MKLLRKMKKKTKKYLKKIDFCNNNCKVVVQSNVTKQNDHKAIECSNFSVFFNKFKIRYETTLNALSETKLNKCFVSF